MRTNSKITTKQQVKFAILSAGPADNSANRTCTEIRKSHFILDLFKNYPFKSLKMGVQTITRLNFGVNNVNGHPQS